MPILQPLQNLRAAKYALQWDAPDLAAACHDLAELILGGLPRKTAPVNPYRALVRANLRASLKWLKHSAWSSCEDNRKI